MANDFQFSIIAKDRYSNVFKDVGAKAGAASKEVSSIFSSEGLKGINQLRGFGDDLKKSFGVGSISRLTNFSIGGGLVIGVGAKMASMAKDAAAVGFNVTKTARALDMSTASLQEYHGAAELAGLSVESMDSALQQMGNTIQDAKFGRSRTATELVRSYDIDSLDQSKTVNRAGALRQLADAIKSLPTADAQRNLAKEFGVEGILPVLVQGSEGLDRMTKSARDMGYVLNQFDLAKSEQLTKDLFALNVQFDTLGRTIGSLTLPAVTKSARAANELLTTPGDFMKRFTEGVAWMDADYLRKVGIEPTWMQRKSFLMPGVEERAKSIGLDMSDFKRPDRFAIPGVPGKPSGGSSGQANEWRVTPQEQAQRDSDAARIVRAEMESETDPGTRAALQRELLRILQGIQTNQGGGDSQGSGSQRVEVHISGLPAGAKATHVQQSTRIVPSMPAGQPW